VAHFAQLHRMAGEFGLRLQHFEDGFRETDQMLLALFKAAYAPQGDGAAGHGGPLSALYLGNDRVLATHPHWPFIYLDATDPVLTPRAITHTYEIGVRLVLERLVKPGATVIDVGAGQGYHTLTLAALTAPGGGRVVAFEPHPRAARFLRESVLCNGLEHVVTLRPVAYHEIGAVLRAEGPQPDVVRIDRTGMEANVLAGIWSCLEAAPNVKIQFPFVVERLLRAGGVAPEELFERLANLHFQLWSAGADGELQPVTAAALLERGGEVVAARELD
jgi:hypothetical protein